MQHFELSRLRFSDSIFLPNVRLNLCRRVFFETRRNEIKTFGLDLSRKKVLKSRIMRLGVVVSDHGQKEATATTTTTTTKCRKNNSTDEKAPTEVYVEHPLL